MNTMAGSLSLVAGSEHILANLHQTNMAANETSVPCVHLPSGTCYLLFGMEILLNLDK